MSDTKQPAFDLALANRLMMFRTKYIDKSQTKAAKKLGIAQSNLSAMERGLIPIKFEFVSKLVKEYDLNQDWYATGNGNDISKKKSERNIVTDINSLNEAMEVLKKHLKIMELNQNYMLKKIDELERKVEHYEGKNKKNS